MLKGCHSISLSCLIWRNVDIVAASAFDVSVEHEIQPTTPRQYTDCKRQMFFMGKNILDSTVALDDRPGPRSQLGDFSESVQKSRLPSRSDIESVLCSSLVGGVESLGQ